MASSSCNSTASTPWPQNQFIPQVFHPISNTRPVILPSGSFDQLNHEQKSSANAHSDHSTQLQSHNGWPMTQSVQNHHTNQTEETSEEAWGTSVPRYVPLAVPSTFIQSCQSTLREVKATSALAPPAPLPFNPKNIKGKVYTSSSFCERKSSTATSSHQKNQAKDNTSGWGDGNVKQESTDQSWGTTDHEASWNPHLNPSSRVPTTQHQPRPQHYQKKPAPAHATAETFPWKHRFPKGWYPMLKKYLTDHLSDPITAYALFKMYVVDDDWSEMNVKGTSEQIHRLEHALYLFVSLNSRSDLHILYQQKQPDLTKPPKTYLLDNLVHWVQWPHPVTQDLDCCIEPFYALVQSPSPNVHGPRGAGFSGLPMFQAPVWPNERIRSRQSADLFNRETFDQLMQQFRVYHEYFTTAFPKPLKWKWSGSLGKHMVSTDHFLSPNQPGTSFPLDSIRERYARGTLRGSFAFNVWHDAETWKTALTTRAGFLAASSPVHTLIMDLPAQHVPNNYVRATFRLDHPAHPPVLKSIKTKAIVPIKFTLSLTDLVYDIRVRLVFTPHEPLIDLSDVHEKAKYLLTHGLDGFQEHYGGVQPKIWSVQTLLFTHPSLPMHAKLACWQSNKNHPPYITLKFNYHPPANASRNTMDEDVAQLLGELFTISSCVPMKGST